MVESDQCPHLKKHFPWDAKRQEKNTTCMKKKMHRVEKKFTCDDDGRIEGKGKLKSHR